MAALQRHKDTRSFCSGMAVLDVKSCLHAGMHFNHYLQALDQDAPPEWQGKFLDYKALKKQVKGLG